MTGECPDILTFEMDQLTEHRHTAQILGHREPVTRYSAEAALNSLKVTPMLDPEAPIEEEDSSKSVKNVFKATFGEVPKYQSTIVVILPFCVPDNLCHFAAREATMVID